MAFEQADDAALIAAIQGRDVHALETLYDRHRVPAYSLAIRSLGNPTDAEDVVQEAFLSIWRAAGSYRSDRSAPRSWILSIVHHRAIDKLRSRKSRVQPVALDEGLQVPDGADVWREVSSKLSGDDVRRALQDLPEEQRRTIELAYFEGYTHVQISELMGVPLGTVKGRMRIGLHKLKTLLQGSRSEVAID
jgi:RNA polymerase sigma-70 factor, ECF subfamily